jgi:hypothetical protein
MPIQDTPTLVFSRHDAFGVAPNRKSRIRHHRVNEIAGMAYQYRKVQRLLVWIENRHGSGAIGVHSINAGAWAPNFRQVAIY